MTPRRRTRVGSRARPHPDRGGDPLDGLVNLFDLGIVLSLAFLLAALSSVDLQALLTERDRLRRAQEARRELRLQAGEQARTVQSGGRVVGKGERIGAVYRLDDGRLVIVEGR